jgi:DNA invertase Pin-like site-specific DNA recombinase
MTTPQQPVTRFQKVASAALQRPPGFGKDHLDGGRAGLYCRVSKLKDARRPGEVLTDKSTEDQEHDGNLFARRRGLAVAGTYSDPDISASRFAREKERPEFNRMLADIRAGKLDVVWFWEVSRSQRRLGVFADLRDLCRDHGVLWAVGDTVYDAASYEDMMLLGVLSIVAEGESEIKSKNVRRGVASNAAAGLPPGPLVYGYRRIYTPGAPGRRLAEALDRQEPDELAGGEPGPLAPVEVNDDGNLLDTQFVRDSPAWIVRECFGRFNAGWGLARIAAHLNERKIPVGRKPGHGNTSDRPEWRDTRIKDMLKNPAYAGQRVHQGEIVVYQEGVNSAWPAIVDPGTFDAAQARFADPDRKKYRTPSVATHLLSSVVRCGSCGHTVRWGSVLGAGRYRCNTIGCRPSSAVKADWLDQYVEDKIIIWGSDPAVYAELAKAGNSATAAAEQAKAARLRARLEEHRQAYEDDDEMSPVMAGRKEKKLLEQIAAAEERARDAVMPRVLADNIGAAFAHRWVNVLDIPVKRQILRHVADIRLLPAGKGNWHKTIADRVHWRWLLGPDAEADDGEALRAYYAAHATQREDRREKVARLRADGWTRLAIARELGVSMSTVHKDLVALGLSAR